MTSACTAQPIPSLYLAHVQLMHIPWLAQLMPRPAHTHTSTCTSQAMPRPADTQPRQCPSNTIIRSAHEQDFPIPDNNTFPRQRRTETCRTLAQPSICPDHAQTMPSTAHAPSRYLPVQSIAKPSPDHEMPSSAHVRQAEALPEHTQSMPSLYHAQASPYPGRTIPCPSQHMPHPASVQLSLCQEHARVPFPVHDRPTHTRNSPITSQPMSKPSRPARPISSTRLTSPANGPANAWSGLSPAQPMARPAHAQNRTCRAQPIPSQDHKEPKPFTAQPMPSTGNG
jgi:hypothetical protein